MADIDIFASRLLEEAKRFLEKAGETKEPDEHQAYLHAALMLAFCSLEAHVNAISSDMLTGAALPPQEQAILGEKDIKLEQGLFVAKGFKIHRLEDRIEFLYRKFSGKKVDKNSGWWPKLAGSLSLRNELTHPKDVPTINLKSVTIAVEGIIETLDALYGAVFGRSFPAASRGLQSKFTF